MRSLVCRVWVNVALELAFLKRRCDISRYKMACALRRNRTARNWPAGWQHDEDVFRRQVYVEAIRSARKRVPFVPFVVHRPIEVQTGRKTGTKNKRKPCVECPGKKGTTRIVTSALVARELLTPYASVSCSEAILQALCIVLPRGLFFDVPHAVCGPGPLRVKSEP